MFLNTALLGSRLARLFRHRDIEAAADRTWELAPAESRVDRPALFLEEDLDKIERVSPYTTEERVTRMIRGGESRHGATRKYLFRNACVTSTGVYRALPPYGARLNRERARFVEEGRLEHREEGALACSWIGNVFFGDWLKCDVPLNYLVREHGPALSVERPPYAHEADYREILDVHTETVRNVRFGRLCLFDNGGQTSHKRKYIEQARENVRKGRGPGEKRPVMLRRGSSGERRSVRNEEAIMDFVLGLGGAVLDPESMTAAEIVDATLDASIVLGVEGSQLAHALYTMADDGCVFVLGPPTRFDCGYKEYTDCMGMRFAFVVGRESEQGTIFDLDGIQRVTDQALSAIG